MFTPHQSVHQFSPQRRQILGTGKRTGQKKAFLGDEEAGNVGPQKLFSDLKNTSSKQASGSNVFSKSPSRALSIKNTQSPQRSQAPLKSAAKFDAGPIKAKSRSPSKPDRQLSPIRDTLTTTPLHNNLDEGTSYHTTASPFPRIPQTPPADLQQQRAAHSFVTPAANVGEAGALRMWKAEMFDALNEVQEEPQACEAEPKAMEEEEFPEIEYMPPSDDISYDFPPQLDGLPRARELGESMAKMSMSGFYKSTSEERKQELLAEIFRFRPGKVELPVISRKESTEVAEMWPDVEVSRSAPAPAAQKSIAGISMSKKEPTKVINTQKASAKPKALDERVSITQKASAKPKALGERDSNATIKKKVMNPALRDFDNDKMGKIIRAKLQASHTDEPEGFLL